MGVELARAMRLSISALASSEVTWPLGCADELRVPLLEVGAAEFGVGAGVVWVGETGVGSGLEGLTLGKPLGHLHAACVYGALEFPRCLKWKMANYLFSTYFAGCHAKRMLMPTKR